MTAREFAHLVNTPYPTVAQWLRDGRVPGAELTDIGHLKVWMIPKDVLKDFKRPEMGRPPLTEEEKAARAKAAKAGKGAQASLFEPPAKPKAKTKKAGVKKSKKGGAAK